MFNNQNKKRISKALVMIGLCTLLNQGVIINKVYAENVDGQNNSEKLSLPINENETFIEKSQNENTIDKNKITPEQKETQVPKESTTPGAVTVPEIEKAPVSEEIPVTITAGKTLARSSKAEVQSKVKIPFFIEQQTFEKKFTAYTFDIVYDSSKLENISIDAYEGIARATIGTPVAYDDSKMKVTVSWKGVLPEESYEVRNGVLFKISFDIKSAFNSGETPIEIINGKLTLSSGAETSNIIAHNGKVLFGIYGDVNGDGKVDSMDVNLMKKKILKKSPKAKVSEDREIGQMASDLNRDGKIDVEDLKELDNSLFGLKKLK